MSAKPSIAFVCCVEAGHLEPMTVRLIESLRRNGGAMADAPVLVVNPRFGPAITRETKRALEKLSARYLHVGSVGSYVWYHFMNKVRAVELAEREFPNVDVIAFLDCDVLFLDEPTEFVLGGDFDVAACTAPDATLAATTGPAHEREAYWRQICDTLGMTVDDLPWVRTTDDVTIRFYLAAGIFAFRRGCGLPRLYRETVTTLMDANLGIGANAEHWLEQASLGLAIVRGGLRWKRLPQSHNCEMTSKVAYHPHQLRSAKLLHYHDSLKPHFFQACLDRIRAERPQHHDWMTAAGPITGSTPLPTRVFSEALRIARGMQRSAYRRRYRAQSAQRVCTTVEPEPSSTAVGTNGQSGNPISVVIPAHNEAGVIGRCLKSLLAGSTPGEAEIVVVCNGCTDDTAAIARSFAGVKVIETAVASKSHALNLGDKAVTAFPRFFIDADVVMPHASLRATARALADGTALAAAPRMDVNLSESSRFVRAFYRVWTRLPYFREGMIGSGAYAVSEAGRRRFDAFPAITADDAFVRLQFSADERRTLPDYAFTITAPKTLHGVVKIKTRGHFGNFELKKRFPELLERNETRHGGALAKLCRQPSLWPSLAIYGYVRIASRILSYRRYRFGDHKHWERDDSSRQVATSV